MLKIQYKTRLWVALVLLTPWLAQAAGLGRLNILSGLGQPLIAEIELISVQRDELATLQARLASPEAFSRANIQYSPALVGVRMSIERRANGQHYVRIVSSRPVNEPFIDLLVELSWAQGRLLREYTGLIDPPPVAQSGNQTAPAVVTAAPAPVAPAATPITPAPAPAPTQVQAPAQKPAPARASTPPASQAGEYGPVKHGDTLSKIAASVRPDGVTLEQALVSLYRSNPDAFAGNMNRLRTGKILRIPDKDQIASTPVSDAAREVRVQTADWNAYRQKLADAAGMTPARESKSTASGKITTAIDDKAGAGPAPKEVLKLSKGEPAAGPDKKGKDAGKSISVQERNRVLEEEAIAREKNLAEANSRIAQLEKTIKDMQRLLEVKGQAPVAKADQVAKAESPKAEAPKVEPAKAEAAKAPEPAKAEPAKTDVAKSPEPAKAETAKPEDAAKPVVAEAPKAEEKKAEAPKQPAPKAKPVAPPPPPEPGLVDQILGEPLYLAAGGGLLAALGGAGYWFARRRRSADSDSSEFDQTMISAPSKVAAGAAAAVAAAPAAKELEDVDPIAEADLYLSFGRDAQAEGVLKEALQKNPGNEAVQLKLLQVYAGRKDKSAFEPLARTLHTQTGGAGENWLKAAAMGFALDPANALYEAGRSAAAPEPVPAVAASGGTDLDFDLELSKDDKLTKTDFELEAGKTVILDASPLSAAAPSHDPQSETMSLTMDVTAGGPGASSPDTDTTIVPDLTVDAPAVDLTATGEISLEAGTQPMASAIDFSLDVPPSDPSPSFTPDSTLILDPDKKKSPEITMDFSLETPSTMDVSPVVDIDKVDTIGPLDPDFKLDLGAEPPKATVPDFKLDDIDLKLDETIKMEAANTAAAVKDDHWYDVQTKFDLAKAYQEMGDKEGAREILNEVVKEGDAGQQAEARKLLETLA